MHVLQVRMYCMGQPRYPGKTWMELFPDMMFPNETEEDQRRSQYLCVLSCV